MQSDQLNHSRLRTVVCIPLTSNMIWSRAPGNVVLPASVTGLPMDSVAVGAQITALPKDMFDECVGTLPENYLRRIIAGLDFVIGR